MLVTGGQILGKHHLYIKCLMTQTGNTTINQNIIEHLTPTFVLLPSLKMADESYSRDDDDNKMTYNFSHNHQKRIGSSENTA